LVVSLALLDKHSINGFSADDDHVENDDSVSEKQRFMLSVIAASPPVDDDGIYDWLRGVR